MTMTTTTEYYMTYDKDKRLVLYEKYQWISLFLYNLFYIKN